MGVAIEEQLRLDGCRQVLEDVPVCGAEPRGECVLGDVTPTSKDLVDLLQGARGEGRGGEGQGGDGRGERE